MARRKKTSSRKKGSSHFWLKLLLFLLLICLGGGYSLYSFPSSRQLVRQYIRLAADKIRGRRAQPAQAAAPEPQVAPEPAVTAPTTAPEPQVAPEPAVTATKPKVTPVPEPELNIPSIPSKPAPTQKEPIIYGKTPYDHLKLGVPGPADTIIDRPGYALGYIEYHEQPAWVVYRLTKEQALTKAAKRNDKFKEDPEIPTGSATLADYRRSGYDRGHLCPAADMAYSIKTMGDSFFMSNMSPQRPQFNRGVWKDLEAQVRDFAIAEHDIYVVTRPVLPKTKTITIGSNKVTVPTHYYKVVYDRTPPEKMIGFILPNDGSDKPLQDFAVTVDAVEEATGLDFFSTVPQPKQEQLESTISVQDWRWKKRK